MPGGTWSGRSCRVLRGRGGRQQSAVGAADVPLPGEHQVGHVFALQGLDAPGLRFRHVGRGRCGGRGGAEGGAVSGAGAGGWAGGVLSGPGCLLLAGEAGLGGARGQAQELGQHQVFLPQQPALVVGPVALSLGNKLKKRCWEETPWTECESLTLCPQPQCTSGTFSARCPTAFTAGCGRRSRTPSTSAHRTAVRPGLLEQSKAALSLPQICEVQTQSPTPMTPHGRADSLGCWLCSGGDVALGTLTRSPGPSHME